MKPAKTIVFLILGVSLILEAAFAQDHEDSGSANDYMNRSSFDQLVRRFESESRIEGQKPDEVIALFGDISDKTIIDIGAGTGLFSFKMAEIAHKVIAADVDDRFIELVRYRIDTMSDEMVKSRIESRKIPYDDPGLKGSEVDGVLLVNTYHHIDGRVEYLKILKRGVRKGGRILIVDFFKDSNFGPSRSHKLAMEVIVKELKDAGYSKIQTDINILEQQYIVIVDII